MHMLLLLNNCDGLTVYNIAQIEILYTGYFLAQAVIALAIVHCVVVEIDGCEKRVFRCI